MRFQNYNEIAQCIKGSEKVVRKLIDRAKRDGLVTKEMNRESRSVIFDIPESVIDMLKDVVKIWQILERGKRERPVDPNRILFQLWECRTKEKLLQLLVPWCFRYKYKIQGLRINNEDKEIPALKELVDLLKSFQSRRIQVECLIMFADEYGTIHSIPKKIISEYFNNFRLLVEKKAKDFVEKEKIKFIWWSEILCKKSERYTKLKNYMKGNFRLLIKDGAIREEYRRRKELSEGSLSPDLRNRVIEHIVARAIEGVLLEELYPDLIKLPFEKKEKDIFDDVLRSKPLPRVYIFKNVYPWRG